MGIGMQSFGGGLSGWIRREIVQRRGWFGDPQFLSGLALCQITPGANSVNMAVFVGTTLRGVPGALAAVSGLMLLPVTMVIGVGLLYFSHPLLPGLDVVLAGLGAGAIGFNLATAVRLTRRNVRSLGAVLVTVVTAVSVGVLNVGLLPALLVMVPTSLLLVGWGRR
jgi:chromate transporter